MDFDRRFKVALLILGFGFLLVYAMDAMKGTYVSIGDSRIMDTRSGKIKYWGHGGGIK